MLPIQKYVIRQYKHCAAKRNIDFLLTDSETLKIMDCACVYCGAMHSNTAIRSQYAVKEFRYNGIDRVNSAQPYSVSNTVACCGACNAAKSNQDLSKFLESDWLKARISEGVA